ncbi:hypothetical protein SAMN04488121_11354 [Chitinophaga filiformis]|uniref:Uncharacterized protein n=1 Tax=Chitinophaga filiformis TaxID=104663 RepID=A0A1G8CVG4_CHIFI|nr:hypothetical protein SAMN04488121_11354 [Chitinophaga filiformis]
MRTICSVRATGHWFIKKYEIAEWGKRRKVIIGLNYQLRYAAIIPAEDGRYVVLLNVIRGKDKYFIYRNIQKKKPPQLLLRRFLSISNYSYHRSCYLLSFNDHPVFNPIINATSSNSPVASSMSPGTRSQRKVCIVGVCMNSAERAYQYPC